MVSTTHRPGLGGPRAAVLAHVVDLSLVRLALLELPLLGLKVGARRVRRSEALLLLLQQLPSRPDVHDPAGAAVRRRGRGRPNNRLRPPGSRGGLSQSAEIAGAAALGHAPAVARFSGRAAPSPAAAAAAAAAAAHASGAA